MVFIISALLMTFYFLSANYFECPRFLDRFSAAVMSTNNTIEWIQSAVIITLNLVFVLQLIHLFSANDTQSSHGDDDGMVVGCCIVTRLCFSLLQHLKKRHLQKEA